LEATPPKEMEAVAELEAYRADEFFLRIAEARIYALASTVPQHHSRALGGRRSL